MATSTKLVFTVSNRSRVVSLAPSSKRAFTAALHFPLAMANGEVTLNTMVSRAYSGEVEQPFRPT